MAAMYKQKKLLVPQRKVFLPARRAFALGLATVIASPAIVRSAGWLPLVAPASGGGSVTLDATGAISQFGPAAGPFDYTGITVGASAKLLVVCIISSGSANEISSVVWDPSGANQSLTLITTQKTRTINFRVMSIYAVDNASLATGNKTLELTVSAADFSYLICAASYIGASGTLATAIPAGNIIQGDSGDVQVHSRTDTITVAAGHQALILDSMTNDSSSGATWSSTPSPTTSQSAGAFRNAMTLGTGTLSSTITTTDLNDYCGGIAIDISP